MFDRCFNKLKSTRRDNKAAESFLRCIDVTSIRF